MCGRTVCHLAPCDIQKACSYKDKDGKTQKPDWRDATNGKKYYPSYNIAPGSHTPILLSSSHFNNSSSSTTRVIQPMLWGLIPSWHRGAVGNKAYETNNCRAESMMDKQTYKIPLQKGRRCVIIAEGFYEWKRDKSTKQPYYIYFPKKSTSNKTENVSDCKCEHKVTAVESDSGHNEKEAHINNSTGEDVKVKIEKQREDVNVKIEAADDVDGVKVKTEPLAIGEFDGDNNVEVKTEPADDFDGVDVKDDVGSSPLLFMAGVFDVWQPEDGTEPVYSYSVITVESSPAMAWLHHRMPALLSTDEEVEEWLNFGEFPISKAVKLIQPSLNVELYPVSTFVNNSRNNSPDCVKKIDPSKRSASSNMMMSWLAKGPSPVKKEPLHMDKKTDLKRKSGSSNIMMNWLSKGPSPVKTEPPDSKRMKLS